MTKFAQLNNRNIAIDGAQIDAAFAALDGDLTATRVRPTGAITSSLLADHLGDITHARDVGMLADYSVTTSSLLQLLSTPGTKQLGSGTYVLDNIVNSATSGLRLVGNGPGATLLLMTNLASGMLALTGNNVSVENLTLAYQGTPTAGAVIELTGLYGRTHNVEIASCWDGLLIMGAGTRHSHMTIENYENSGLTANNANDICLSDSIMNAGNTSRGRLGGIRLQNKVEAFNVSTVDVLLGIYGMTTAADVNRVGTRPAYCGFLNLYLDSAAAAGALLQYMVESYFLGSWFSAGRGADQATGIGPGVYQLGCDSILYGPGTRLFNCGGHGALVDAASNRTTFLGVAAESNSFGAGPGIAHGIAFQAGACDFEISHSTLHNGLYPGQQGFGALVNAGASDRYNITNNRVSGNYTGGVADGGTGTNKLIQGNF